MRVTVRLIGAPRVALKFKERDFEVAEGASVAGLVATIVEEVGPKAATYLLGVGGRGYSVVFVVNGESARPETPLTAGDVVIVMPQTAGGA
jgi:molybdopterin converting factor small subunit